MSKYRNYIADLKAELKTEKELSRDCEDSLHKMRTRAESAEKALAYSEAVLIDCQKAHDVTIVERDEYWTKLERIRENCADENLPDDIIGGRTRAILDGKPKP